MAERDRMEPCCCGSGRAAGDCCEPMLEGRALAVTCEALMRSRYAAFVAGNGDYLRATWHPSTRPARIEFDPRQRWLGLKVVGVEAGEAGDSDGWVAFVARYKIAGKGHRLKERSRFQRLQGRWVYVDGEF